MGEKITHNMGYTFILDGVGELSGLIDGVSCAVEFGKWNPSSPIMFYIKYPECKNMSPGWTNYTDKLFVTVRRSHQTHIDLII